MLRSVFDFLMYGSFYDTPWIGWSCAVIVTVGVSFALRRLTRTLSRRLTVLTQRTDNVVDDLFLDVLGRTRWSWYIAMGVWAGGYFVELADPWDDRVHTTIAVVVIVQVALWASGAVDHMVVVFLEHRAPNQDIAHRTGRNIMRALGIGGVWVLALLMCLDNFGVDVSALITGLGITGVALAFAGQQIGGDIFASASILLDQPFLVGDFIIVDGLKGTVERIGIRTTHLRSLDGERIIFANSDLAKSRVRNFKTMVERRVVFTFGIRHDTPSDRIVALGPRLRHLFDTIACSRFERATWHSFGTYALMYEVVYFVLDQDLNVYMQTQQTVNVALLRALEAEGIALAVGTPVRMVQAEEMSQALAAAAAGVAPAGS
jgi:small-conductance mechanosensitive channel